MLSEIGSQKQPAALPSDTAPGRLLRLELDLVYQVALGQKFGADPDSKVQPGRGFLFLDDQWPRMVLIEIDPQAKSQKGCREVHFLVPPPGGPVNGVHPH